MTRLRRLLTRLGLMGPARRVLERLGLLDGVRRLLRPSRRRVARPGGDGVATALPAPQLPALAGAPGPTGHPNRLGAVTPTTAGVTAGDGPWRDVGTTSVRAAHAAGLDLLGVAPPTGTVWVPDVEVEVAPSGPVVVADEEARGWLEWHRPELVGRVEVAAADHERWSRATPTDPARLAVVGTDLKFLRPLLGVLERTGRVVATVDEWPRFRHAADDERTAAVVAGAEVVLAEWCGPNAVRASRLVRDDQRLVVRLHRFELGEPDWRELDVDRVDVVVAVSEPYRREILAVTGWPTELVVVVPNAVDVHHLDRPKLPSARWTLGMLGVDRSRKRLDRGLDVLARLRAHDPRWQLRVKGSPPWSSRWVQQRPEEAAWFDEQLARLADEPLRDGVVFDPRGPDVASWLRGVGHVLSPSDDESFHLSPAEGMASGAVPVLWPWPGSDEIYHRDWVVRDADEAAAVLADRVAGDQRYADEIARARRTVTERYLLEDVAARFGDVLLGR